MDEIKIIYEVFDAITFSAAGCNCKVITGTDVHVAESLIVVIKPPPE